MDSVNTGVNLETMLENLSAMRKIQGRLSSPYLTKYHFSPNEMNILILLSNNSSIDTAKELALYLGVSKGLICRSLDRLIERGFLLVKEDKLDRRLLRLAMQDTAKSIIEPLKKAKLELGQKMLEGIDEEDLKTMERVFYKMKENVKKLEEDSDENIK